MARKESRLPDAYASMRLLHDVFRGENRTSMPTKAFPIPPDSICQEPCQTRPSHVLPTSRVEDPDLAMRRERGVGPHLPPGGATSRIQAVSRETT